jgi:PIN domain nuclease of toxin-antitoxin system
VRILLDSHAVLWYVDQDQMLSGTAHAAITDPANDLLVSAATIWELAIKAAIGKLSLSQPYRLWMNKAMSDLRASLLPVQSKTLRSQRHSWTPFIDRPSLL